MPPECGSSWILILAVLRRGIALAAHRAEVAASPQQNQPPNPSLRTPSPPPVLDVMSDAPGVGTTPQNPPERDNHDHLSSPSPQNSTAWFHPSPVKSKILWRPSADLEKDEDPFLSRPSSQNSTMLFNSSPVKSTTLWHPESEENLQSLELFGEKMQAGERVTETASECDLNLPGGEDHNRSLNTNPTQLSGGDDDAYLEDVDSRLAMTISRLPPPHEDEMAMRGFPPKNPWCAARSDPDNRGQLTMSGLKTPVNWRKTGEGKGKFSAQNINETQCLRGGNATATTRNLSIWATSVDFFAIERVLTDPPDEIREASKLSTNAKFEHFDPPDARSESGQSSARPSSCDLLIPKHQDFERVCIVYVSNSVQIRKQYRSVEYYKLPKNSSQNRAYASEEMAIPSLADEIQKALMTKVGNRPEASIAEVVVQNERYNAFIVRSCFQSSMSPMPNRQCCRVEAVGGAEMCVYRHGRPAMIGEDAEKERTSRMEHAASMNRLPWPVELDEWCNRKSRIDVSRTRTGVVHHSEFRILTLGQRAYEEWDGITQCGAAFVGWWNGDVKEIVHVEVRLQDNQSAGPLRWLVVLRASSVHLGELAPRGKALEGESREEKRRDPNPRMRVTVAHTGVDRTGMIRIHSSASKEELYIAEFILASLLPRPFDRQSPLALSVFPHANVAVHHRPVSELLSPTLLPLRTLGFSNLTDEFDGHHSKLSVYLNLSRSVPAPSVVGPRHLRAPLLSVSSYDTCCIASLWSGLLNPRNLSLVVVARLRHAIPHIGRKQSHRGLIICDHRRKKWMRRGRRMHKEAQIEVECAPRGSALLVNSARRRHAPAVHPALVRDVHFDWTYAPAACHEDRRGWCGRVGDTRNVREVEVEVEVVVEEGRRSREPKLTLFSTADWIASSPSSPSSDLTQLDLPAAASEVSPSSPSRPFLLLGVFGATSLTLVVPIVMFPETCSGSSYYIPRLPPRDIRIRVVVILSLRQDHSAARRVPYLRAYQVVVLTRAEEEDGYVFAGGDQGSGESVSMGDREEMTVRSMIVATVQRDDGVGRGGSWNARGGTGRRRRACW
ncbi:hypothetical protein R3P38DRAFT_2816060 [Favolaschia claudopus]|uniref:Uncharacterized protein n=1 Tax=Favolaschia claudopus TaxID=2862362 RepID=A0AAV9YZU9_9AGAR